MQSSQILTYIRMRPASKEDSSDQSFVPVDEQQISDVKQQKNYLFEEVFPPGATNESVFERVCLPAIRENFNGYNSCVFAYGQTSSGKTHTMKGHPDAPGLIPLAIQAVYALVEQLAPSAKVFTKISYLEIYNETIIDLLNTTNENLDVRETKNKMIAIMGLKEVEVKDQEAAMRLYHQGEANKKVGPTASNSKSSRSHTIFRMQMTIHPKDITQDVTTSTLNLIDLAGSESITKSKTEGIRQKEGTSINKSLLALSNVINKLSKNENRQFINFRDSKLTRILGPHLTGNSKTVVVCTVNPTENNYVESINTLSFAQKVGAIVNVVRPNAPLSDYKPQDNELRETLEQMAVQMQQQILDIEIKDKDLIFKEQELKALSQELAKMKKLKDNQVDFNQTQQQELDFHRSNTARLTKDHETLYENFQQQRQRADQIQADSQQNIKRHQDQIDNLLKEIKQLKAENEVLRQKKEEKQEQTEQKEQEQEQEQEQRSESTEQIKSQDKEEPKEWRPVVEHKVEQISDSELKRQDKVFEQRDRYCRKIQEKSRECAQQNITIQALRHELANAQEKVESLRRKLMEYRWMEEEEEHKEQEIREGEKRPRMLVRITTDGHRKRVAVEKRIDNSLSKADLKRNCRNIEKRMKHFQGQLSAKRQEVLRLIDENKEQVEQIHGLQARLFLDSQQKQIIDTSLLGQH